MEAVTSEPVSVRGLLTGKFAGNLRGNRAPWRVWAPSPTDKSTAYGRLGDFPETRNREISGIWKAEGLPVPGVHKIDRNPDRRRLRPVCVPVMNVRVVRVPVGEHFVPVRMHMRRLGSVEALLDHPVSQPGWTIWRPLRQSVHVHSVFLLAARPCPQSVVGSVGTGQALLQGRARLGRQDVART